MFNRKIKNFSFSDFKPELQILIRAGESALDKSKLHKLEALLEQFNDINWERVYQLACIHQIRPLLLRGVSQLKNNPIPQEVLLKLKQDCVYIAGRNLTNTQEMLRLLTLFKENNITAVPYKGAYLANTYYGDFGLREFSDIDLFVHEHQLPQLKKIMQQENYIPQWDLNPQQEKMFLSIVCEYNYNLF
ncbi:MAG TPA: nucleotidyltransferase family protein, partial [Allocoleopsis sp.]